MLDGTAAIVDTLVGILVDLRLPVVLLAIRPAGCQLALRRYGLLALMDEALADIDERGDAQWIQCTFVERRHELLPLDHVGPELRRPESAEESALRILTDSPHRPMQGVVAQTRIPSPYR